jgi:hypothetical protein
VSPKVIRWRAVACKSIMEMMAGYGVFDTTCKKINSKKEKKRFSECYRNINDVI